MFRSRLVVTLIGLNFLAAVATAQTTHPAEKSGLKSFVGDTTASIGFLNKSGQTIRIYWLNYEGGRELYNTLKDGELCTEQTFLTHPWLIADDHDNAWSVYYADSQPRTVVITPQTAATTQPARP